MSIVVGAAAAAAAMKRVTIPTIYWFEDHEVTAYNDSAWVPGGNNAAWNTNVWSLAFTTTRAKSGTRALEMTIDTTTGLSAVRMPVYRQLEFPDAAYYSAWYWIPANIVPDDWWNILDWKTAHQLVGGGGETSDPTYSIDCLTSTGGSSYFLSITNHVNPTTGLYDNGFDVGFETSATFSPDEWVHIENYYRWDTTANGQITTWINGVQQWDVTGIRTQHTMASGRELSIDPRQYKINHYSPGLTPESSTIWVDDAAITSARIYPIYASRNIGRFAPQASADDAEQTAGTGAVTLTSTDLDLGDTGGLSHVGIRFRNVRIPQGATIDQATVRFHVNEASTGACSLTIKGEAADDAAAFTTATNDISSRSLTTASVAWSPPDWGTVQYTAYPDQHTPELKTIIQEIVNRAGWVTNNNLVLIITGTGNRVASSWDEGANNRPGPQLIVVWH